MTSGETEDWAFEVDPVLESLNGPYALTHFGQWVEWFEPNYKSGRYTMPEGLDQAFERVFAPYAVFDYYHVGALFGPYGEPRKGPQYPYASFVSSWIPPQDEDHELFEKEYESAKSHYLKEAEGGIVPRKRIQELAYERDTLEKQVRHSGEQLAVVVNSLEAVLKAWLAEALRSAEKYDAPETPPYDSERVRIIGGAGNLWVLIIGGNSLYRSFLGKSVDWVERLLTHECVDPLFTKAQLKGLMYYMEPREILLDYAYRIDRRRLAIEWVLYHALLRTPLRAAKDIIGDLSDERAKWLTDGRAAGKHLEPKMVKCYWAFRDSVLSEGLSTKKVREKVLRSFGDPIGDRQFQNYITGNDRPKLTDEEVKQYLTHLGAIPFK